MKKKTVKAEKVTPPETSSYESPREPEVATSSYSQTKTFFLVLVLLGIFGVATYMVRKDQFAFPDLKLPPAITNLTNSFTAEQSFPVKKFASEEEFRNFLQKSEDYVNLDSGLSGSAEIEDRAVMNESRTAPMPVAAGNAKPMAPYLSGDAPTRVSETNVQVQGIDEPDIVKTDGEEIFLSHTGMNYYPGRPMPMMERREVAPFQTNPSSPRSIAPGAPLMPPVPPSMPQNQIKVLKAFPPSELAEKGKIVDKNGNLLLHENTLMVFSRDVIYGYDVSQPENPSEKWKLSLEKERSNSLVSSRLMDGKVFLVLRANLDRSAPCPIRPLQVNNEVISVPCTDIYYPTKPVGSITTTYTVLKVDAQTGKVEKTTSFVGPSSSNIMYMSPESLYLTYSQAVDEFEFASKFFAELGKDVFPKEVLNKINTLSSYEISNKAKMVEFQRIIEDYQRSLSKDEQMRIENEMENKMENYLKDHVRDLQKTGIVKVKLDSFDVQATASVPGKLLNQFSMDEYQGNLRVATTFGGRGSRGTMNMSASDVYVFDSGLHQKGVVKDLGKEERIYSVRFIQDKGYVVTFRETDPFYVLDLSDPSNPQKKGELKIPGYSSYLHPLSKDLILGVGKEDQNVKVSLFDVSDPSNPTEASKYMLSEYSSELLNNHHAFLHDEKHGVFFFPGTQGGYIFSYKDKQLSLVKTIADIQAQRALYLNNYLYIIGRDQIVVLNESDWETVTRLRLE